MVSRDPEENPKLTDEMREMAQHLGMKIVHVILDRPNARVGDSGGVAIFTLADFIPRVGEVSETRNGQICRV